MYSTEVLSLHCIDTWVHSIGPFKLKFVGLPSFATVDAMHMRLAIKVLSHCAWNMTIYAKDHTEEELRDVIPK